MAPFHDNQVSQRIHLWLDELEKQATLLLEEADCIELKPKERFMLASQYIALTHRFLLLAQKQEAAIPSNDAQRALDSLRAVMRNQKFEDDNNYHKLGIEKGASNADRHSGL